MGYSEIQKGYILYYLTNMSFFVNRNTIFQEYEFLFHKTASEPPIFVDNLVADHVEDHNEVRSTTDPQTTSTGIVNSSYQPAVTISSIAPTT